LSLGLVGLIGGIVPNGLLNVGSGSRAEELKGSTTSPLYPEKQTLARAAGMSH